MSTQDPAVGYAFWISPDGSQKIVYSLALFQEIDALVNDAYRRIPHGGVEVGGLLFGRRDERGLQLEAYRLIECQHAFGPSFVLSEGDLSGVKQQLDSFESDDELRGLQPAGWFIGHTRNALLLSDREASWFADLFPFPQAVTILVKPERFQPTRFGFLVRTAEGDMERDAAKGAVILPLSVGAAGGRPPAASIPAPIPAPPPAPQPVPHPVFEEEPVPVSAPEVAAEPEPALDPEPAPLPLPRPVRAPSVDEPTRVRQQPPSPPPARPAAYPYATLGERRTPIQRASGGGFGLKSAAILVLAALLGCVAGYLAYLQLPSPVIPVSVREQSGQLVVEWPSALTDNVDYAALQVNDGQWMALSPEQKTAGHAVVPAPAGDIKIDLLAKHWLRDSRGIVRYVRR